MSYHTMKRHGENLIAYLKGKISVWEGYIIATIWHSGNVKKCWDTETDQQFPEVLEERQIGRA